MSQKIKGIYSIVQPVGIANVDFCVGIIISHQSYLGLDDRKRVTAIGILDGVQCVGGAGRIAIGFLI